MKENFRTGFLRKPTLEQLKFLLRFSLANERFALRMYRGLKKVPPSDPMRQFFREEAKNNGQAAAVLRGRISFEESK